MHHLINKPSPRTSPRKGTPGYHSESIKMFNNKMDGVYIYATTATPGGQKMIKRRESRIRSSLFGSGLVKRESYELPSEVVTGGMRSPSRSMTSGLDDKENNTSFLGRRKLRKSSSYASLSSLAFVIEPGRQEKAGRKGFADLLRGGKTSPTRQTIGQRKLSHEISEPFDFFHITHGNSQQFPQLQQADDRSLVRDWHNVVRDSTMPSLQKTIAENDSTVVATPSKTTLQRTTSVRSRKRANSVKSVSPRESMNHNSPNSPTHPEGLRYTFPPNPPLRVSSRHCLRSLKESPTEEEEECVFRPGRQSKLLHAVTTQGKGSYKKSTGVEKLMKDRLADDSDSFSPISASDGFEEPSLSELRASKSTPDLLSLQHRRYLSATRRPMSQVSAVSDTLNGTFVPPSPHITSMSPRCVSRRVSVHMRPEALADDSGDFPDSWEEDIDWCYEHEVDADCEFDWDRGFEHEAICVQECTDKPTPLSKPLKLNDILKAAGGRESFVLVENRITGVFEDKLLLPPSPQLAGFPDSTIGIADGGFDAYGTESEDIIFRAATTARRHRSISSTASLPELVPSRSYREELSRVARQLDDHIAALNQGAYFLQPLTTDIPSPHALLMGNRPRADSEASCATLCSDTDTITPVETSEVITPSSSAHNSLHFAQHTDEGRAQKGLSFPAAALPGVIEFAPDGVHHIVAEEQGFLHFI